MSFIQIPNLYQTPVVVAPPRPIDPINRTSPQQQVAFTPSTIERLLKIVDPPSSAPPSSVPSSAPTAGQQPSSSPSSVPTSGQQPSSSPSSVPTSGQQPSSSPSSVPTSGQQTSSSPSSVPTSGQQPSASPSSVPTSGQQTSSSPSSVPTSGQQTSSSPSSVPTSGQQPSNNPSSAPSAGGNSTQVSTTVIIPDFTQSQITDGQTTTSNLRGSLVTIGTQGTLTQFTNLDPSNSDGYQLSLTEKLAITFGVTATVAAAGFFFGTFAYQSRNHYFGQLGALLRDIRHNGGDISTMEGAIENLESLWRFPIPGYSNEIYQRGGVRVAIQRLQNEIQAQAEQAEARMISAMCADMADSITNSIPSVPGNFPKSFTPAPKLLGIPDRSSTVTSVQAPTIKGDLSEILPVTRLLSRTWAVGASINITNLDPLVLDAYRILYDVQLAPSHTPEKAALMMLAQIVMTNVNLNQASLNSDSNQVLTKLLNPIFKFEVASFELSELSQDRLATQLIASNNVSITKLDSSKFTWDYHFIQPGSSFSSDMYNYQSTYIFGDKNKNFYRAPDNANRYVSLDNEHSQYVGSNGNEIINLDGESIVPFYVRAGSGDDVIKISSSLFKTSQAVVNIIGGGGKNTYVIDVADGRTSLPGQIHIWDFDPNKDTIYFNTYGSYAALNIQETKRTLSSSPYKIAAIWPDSTVSLSKVYKKSFFWNLFFPSYSSYSAAEHEFTGNGIAKLILDESNYDPFNPNKFFSNSKTFKTDAMADVLGTVNTNAQIYVGTSANTIWSQLENAIDHDFFKVHLSKGKSYVFKLESNPLAVGDAIFRTDLQLRDKFGNKLVETNLAVNSKYDRDYADTKIDFIATSDGDYFLDAGSSYSAGKYSLSATEIVRKSISLNSNNKDAFDPTTNHLAYKMTLNAGDFVQLNFESTSRPTITVSNDLGNKVEVENLSASWNTGGPYRSSNLFHIFAKTSGDYYIDASIPLNLNKNAPENLVTNAFKWDDYSANSKYVLQENSIVKGTLGNSSEHDFYHVRLNAGSKYQFDLQAAASSPYLDTYLKLNNFDQSATLLESDDINMFDHNSRLVFTATKTGFYDLDVSSYAHNSLGDYTIGFRAINNVI